MGQTTSQESTDSPVSRVKKSAAPLRPHEPPKLQVKPVPRAPSYAVPENKVLPTELPSKPLRAISASLSKSNPELESLFVDKENKPVVSADNSVDHNFYPEKNGTIEKNGVVNGGKQRAKYPAPSPPCASVSPLRTEPSTDNNTIPLDHFYNRSALAHRRTNSLDRLPVSRVSALQRRPVSAVNLTSSEHIIFEDPEETVQTSPRSQTDSKNTSLPQKSTFPMDYSYAVTYAQLAEHRRKQYQSKLNSEKEVLAKQQSLPNLNEREDMDPHTESYFSQDGAIDLDCVAPKKKKYRAPPPPSAVQVAKTSPQQNITQRNGGLNRPTVVPVSGKQRITPVEPPVDYDTGECTDSARHRQEISVQHISGESSPSQERMRNVSVSSGSSVPSGRMDEPVSQSSRPVIILHSPQSDVPVSPMSPKSPPPRVAPKPVRSPDKGRFRFPSVQDKPDTDIVTVNGQVIPEKSPQPDRTKEVISLSIDCKSETVEAALVPQAPVTAISSHVQAQDRNGNFTSQVSPAKESQERQHIHKRMIITNNKLNTEAVSPGYDKALEELSKKYQFEQKMSKPHETRTTAQEHLGQESPVISPVRRNLENGHVVNVSSDINSDIVKSGDVVRQNSVGLNTNESDVTSIPVGQTADIILDPPVGFGSDDRGSSQPLSSSDSGVTAPLSDQSFESLTTGDRSVEYDASSPNADDTAVNSSVVQVSQGTMTMPPQALVIDGMKESSNVLRKLDRSLSMSSGDSAKPASPPLTPDGNQPAKMNSLLQNDIVAAAEVRVLKLKKPQTSTPPPKSPEDVFKEQLAKIHQEREGRIKQNMARDKSEFTSSENDCQSPARSSISEIPVDKGDSDSGIHAYSFPEDWTPEHDLEDSDDERHPSALTSRSGLYYDKVNGKHRLKAKPSFSSNRNARQLKKSESDASDKYKFGSLRRFRENVHRSVKQAFNSVNRSSSSATKADKVNKLDKRSSLPPNVSSTPETKQPVFRKIDPDAVDSVTTDTENSPSVNGVRNKQVSEEKKMMENPQSDSENQVKKAGVAYVSGKGQIVLLPEFEDSVSPKKHDSDDSHRAPKRWKKMKKFSYMATTRRKEKEKMEQLLQDRIAEQEKRMEQERQRQLEMELEFMKVRQVDKKELQRLNSNGVSSGVEENSVSTVSSSPTGSPAESAQTTPKLSHSQVTVNGEPQGHTGDIPTTSAPSFSMPGLVPAPNLLTTSQAQVNPLLLTRNSQPYNSWFHSQPVQSIGYSAPLGLGISNYGSLPTQYPQTSLPYDLANYMQMLNVNGQTVNVPVSGGLVNGYGWGIQSLDRNQTVQYNGTTYIAPNTIPVQQIDNVQLNNNNQRSLKQTVYVNPGTIDDSILNQMYAEYDNGQRNTQFNSDDKKKRSNPLYYSSDEEEEYDVRDVHSGQIHTKGTVARISVPDHHSIHNNGHHVRNPDEEMPSPSSVTSCSTESGPSHYGPKGTQNSTSSPQFRSRSGSTSEPVNLDESYSSADR